MWLTNNTVALNTAPNGAGIYISIEAKLGVRNNIVANNLSGSDCVQAGGTVTLQGENLDTDNSCPLFSLMANPLLVGLADNGGNTLTHALMTGSPAIDVVTTCNEMPTGGPLNEDQRGAARPEGSACDLGAYESVFGSPPPEEPPIITFIVNVNCRIGPHYDHIVVLTHLEGDTAEVVGQNEDGSWLAAAAPPSEDGDGEPWCWVPEEWTTGDFDRSTLPQLDHLLDPSFLIPKDDEPESEKKGCWVKPPSGGDPVCTFPCPPGAVPGGACKP